MVLFTRRYKIRQMKRITFYQQELTCVKQMKYLGVILDSKLNWKAHVDAKCQKAITAFISYAEQQVRPGDTLRG